MERNTCERCGVTGLFDHEIHPDSVECDLPSCYDCWHSLIDEELERTEATREYRLLLAQARRRAGL